MQRLVMPGSKKGGFVERVPSANCIGLLLISLVMESKSFFSGVGKQTNTHMETKPNRKKKTYRKRSYPCYSAIGPRPTPPRQHKIPLHRIFSAPEVGFQPESSNLVCPGRKQPHLPKQSALWQRPTSAKLHKRSPAQV